MYFLLSVKLLLTLNVMIFHILVLKRCFFGFEKTLNWLARDALLGAYKRPFELEVSTF